MTKKLISILLCVSFLHAHASNNGSFLEGSMGGTSEFENSSRPVTLSARYTNIQKLDLPSSDNESFVAPLSSQFSLIYPHRFQETKLKKILRIGSAIVMASAIGNAMIPIFLEDAAESGIPINYSTFLSAAIYTGITYGLETLSSRLERSIKSKIHPSWYAVCVSDALLHVYYLYNVERNHHIDVHDQGWDIYNTFFVVLAPFLFVNEFSDSKSFGQSFFMTPQQKSIKSTLDQLSLEETHQLYKDVVVEKKESVYLSLVDKKEVNSRLYYWLPALNFPVSVLCFGHAIEESAGRFVEMPYLFSYICALAPALCYSYFQYRAIMSFKKDDLWGLFPQGVYKNIPLFALSYQATKFVNDWIRYPFLVLFNSLACLHESREIRDAFLNLAAHIPKLKERPSVRKHKLKEYLL